MIDLDILVRTRAYTYCEPDSQPPTHADLKALLTEVDRLASELAKVPPTLTPGGPMPEPWPGMGVETVDDTRIDRWTPDLAMVNGVWYMLPHGALAEDDEIKNEYLRLDDATAIYDGRRCIWRRNP